MQRLNKILHTGPARREEAGPTPNARSQPATTVLESAVEICKAAELAATQNRALESEAKVQRVEKIANAAGQSRTSGQRRRCGYCGKIHGPRRCPAFGKTCTLCNKRNHFAACCRSRRGVHELGVAATEDALEESSDATDEDIQVLTVQIRNVSKNQDWTVAGDLAGHPTELKVDTGAQANILPYSYFRRMRLPTMTSEGRKPAARPEAPTGSKCRARDDPDNSPAVKINLQEFIPQSQVIDYEEAGSRSVRLSGFANGVRAEDVVGLCSGAVETSTLIKDGHLTLYYVAYRTAEEAVAAVQALDGVLVKGTPIRATYLAERWHDPGTCPRVSSNILDISNLPREFRSKEKLEPVFKMGKVTAVSATGSCTVEFPSPAELIKTVSDRSCHRLDGQSLKFAMAYEPVAANSLGNKRAGAAKRSKESSPSGTSKVQVFWSDQGGPEEVNEVTM
ncbi:hypothetical protein MRX96_049891 [Rhipicephalus microplus]